MPITRRDAVVAALSVGVAGTAYSWHSGAVTAGDVSNVTGGVVSTPDPNAMEQELGTGFDRLQWHENGDATIYWHDDHSMDGFYIQHEYDDEDYIDGCNAPRFGGGQRYPLVAMLRLEDAEYPTRRFNLIAAKGWFNDCRSEISGMASMKERLGVESFTVPEQFDL